MNQQVQSGTAKATSPAGTGPAGAHLEGQIGAQYLLSLLGAGAPRGLPGVATVSRVAFQGAVWGFPMDDLIVSGHLHGGQPATLELQAKRTLRLTAGDKTFADIVKRAVEASRKPEFQSQHYIVAAAVGRTSTQIEQHVQWVLKWAREKQDHATFFEHLQRPGFASEPDRKFVAAFRGHMEACGGSSDEAAAWQLLRRFLVLVFNFEGPDSYAKDVVHDRCVAALAPQDKKRAAELWDTLVDHALSLGSAGGYATPESLKAHLAERSYRLAGERRWRNARKCLADDTKAALRDIQRDVAGLCLPRQHLVDAAQAALASAGYLEIRGSGGVGKSAVLATLAEFRAAECHVMLLAPGRVPGGGWGAMRERLLLDDASAPEFLADLAGDGGGLLCIDGIDRFSSEAEQQTVKELMHAAAETPGFKVVATARDDFADRDAREWIPRDALATLKVATMEPVAELRDDEAELLARHDAALAALLSSRHPARALVRNLHRLDRLVTWTRDGATDGAGSSGAAPVSEAQMAWQWWRTGDGPQDSIRRLRTRLLHELAVHALDPQSGPMDCRERSHEAIEQLVKSRSLHEPGWERIDFAHDVLRDWAVGCLLVSDEGQILKLPLRGPAPASLARGVEIAARLLAEGVHLVAHAATEARQDGLSRLLAGVSQPGTHGSWRRSALLALARSERAEETLTACSAMLVADDGRLLQELVGYVIAVDSRHGPEALAGQTVPSLRHALHSVALPAGASWLGLISWTLNHPELIPDQVVPSLVELYRMGMLYVMARADDADATAGRMMAQLHEWLVSVERLGQPTRDGLDAAPKLVPRRRPLNMAPHDQRMLRAACLTWPACDRARTRAYLRRVARSAQRDEICREMLDSVDGLPQAMPKEAVDFFLATLCDPRTAATPEGPFAFWDTVFYPASPSRRPFLELLRAKPDQGLRLVRAVVSHALLRVRKGDLKHPSTGDVPLVVRERVFENAGSYSWARGHAGAVVGSALMALEAWGHERLEAAEPVDTVLVDVLGPKGSCAAFVLVAVDLVLSNLPRSLEMAAYFASSAQLLALDHQRLEADLAQQQDTIDSALGMSVLRPEIAGLGSRASLLQRPSRTSCLDGVILTIGCSGPDGLRAEMRQRLQEELSRLGGAPADLVDIGARALADPRIAAAVGLSRLEPDRHEVRAPSDDAGRYGWRYRPSEIEQRIFAAQVVAKHAFSGDLHLRLREAVQRRPADIGLMTAALAWIDRDADRRTAQGASADASIGEDLSDEDRSRTIVAALLLRDAPDELRNQREDWAIRQLRVAMERQPSRSGAVKALPYNEAAIAAVGFMAGLRRNAKLQLGDLRIVRSVLELAARVDASMAAVITDELNAGCRIEARLGRAVCRLGLASATFESPDADEFEQVIEDDPLDQRVRRAANRRRCEERDQARATAGVAAELRWLNGEAPEPEWPELPRPWPVVRLGLNPQRFPKCEVSVGPSNVVASTEDLNRSLDIQVAATWFAVAGELCLLEGHDWVRQLLHRYWLWTCAANGVDADLEDRTPMQVPLGWNPAYFAVAAKAGACGATARSEVWRATLLPDYGFFIAARAMLQTVDELWLQRGLATVEQGRTLRAGIVGRMEASREWQNLAQTAMSGHSWPFAELVAAVFLCEHQPGQGATCKLPPHTLSPARALLPDLVDVADKGARSVVVAAAFLGLMEMVADQVDLPLVARVHAAWCRAHGADRAFWTGQRIAPRLCEWIRARVVSPNAPAPGSDPLVVGMLDALVRVGSDGAQALERLFGIQPEREQRL